MEILAHAQKLIKEKSRLKNLNNIFPKLLKIKNRTKQKNLIFKTP